MCFSRFLCGLCAIFSSLGALTVATAPSYWSHSIPRPNGESREPTANLHGQRCEIDMATVYRCSNHVVSMAHKSGFPRISQHFITMPTRETMTVESWTDEGFIVPGYRVLSLVYKDSSGENLLASWLLPYNHAMLFIESHIICSIMLVDQCSGIVYPEQPINPMFLSAKTQASLR